MRTHQKGSDPAWCAVTAEREGFEPSLEVYPPDPLSRRAPSATRPPLPDARRVHGRRPTPLSTIPPHVAARPRRMVGQPPRGLESRVSAHGGARLAQGPAALADHLGTGRHRVGFGLLHPHLARRLPPRE